MASSELGTGINPQADPDASPPPSRSMGALVHCLAGTDMDTGINPEALLPLIDFWDATRTLYRPFESNLLSSSSGGGEETAAHWGPCPQPAQQLRWGGGRAAGGPCPQPAQQLLRWGGGRAARWEPCPEPTCHTASEPCCDRMIWDRWC